MGHVDYFSDRHRRRVEESISEDSRLHYHKNAHFAGYTQWNMNKTGSRHLRRVEESLKSYTANARKRYKNLHMTVNKLEIKSILRRIDEIDLHNMLKAFYLITWERYYK